MATHALLLRGINVGRHRQIGMADLRDVVTGLGYEDVRTYLRSGNVVLTGKERPPDRIARDVRTGIADRFGFDVDVLVRSGEEMAEVVAGNPFPEALAEPSRLFVAFLAEPVDDDRVRTVDPAEYEPDRFHARGRQVYHWCPNGLASTTLSPAFWKALCGDAITTVRNWNTVTKLAHMLAE